MSLSLLPQAPWLASPAARPCPLPSSEARGPVPRPGAAGPHKCRTSFFFGRVFGLLHRKIGFSRPVSSLAYFRARGGWEKERQGRLCERVKKLHLISSPLEALHKYPLAQRQLVGQ